MNKFYTKIVKNSSILLFLALTLNSCIYLNIDGSTNFSALVNSMVKKSIKELNKNLYISNTVLVSDFVNIDNLKNRSKLGFLLSSTLKDRLLSNNIMVKEVELRNSFTLNSRGFNLLSRDLTKVNKKIKGARYALVGTYSITTKSLIVFIKMIDLQTGNIVASSQEKTIISDEILQLEKRDTIPQGVYNPMVL